MHGSAVRSVAVACGRGRTGRGFIEALEGALAALGDEHATLSRRSPESARRIPAETDLWAR